MISLFRTLYCSVELKKNGRKTRALIVHLFILFYFAYFCILLLLLVVVVVVVVVILLLSLLYFEYACSLLNFLEAIFAYCIALSN